MEIVDLTAAGEAAAEQTARLLHRTFRGRSEDWQELDGARAEVRESLVPGRVSRVAVDAAGEVIGWIGGIPSYHGRVWELHPMVVSPDHRGRGVGRALVADLERMVRGRGGETLWLGSDDENGETTVAGRDLYPDIPGAIRALRVLEGGLHPLEFYRALGFRVVGLLPDANGPGKPDIFLAKRLAGTSPP